jgi:nucleolin
MTPLFMSSSNSLEEPATADDATTSSSSSAITNDESTSTTEEQKEEDVKIYIGNISYSESKANIRKLFQTYGEVTDVFLPLNRETREGRGFGFVAMKDRAAAEKAVQELNQTTFGERTIYVNMAGEQRQQQQERTSRRSPPPKKYIKLYVGNISFDSTEEELKELFQNYGTVHDCFLPTWPDTGNLRGFAFISMDPEEAELAITNMDGTEFHGRVISVSKAMARKEKLERMSGGINGSTSRKGKVLLYSLYSTPLFLPFVRNVTNSLTSPPQYT